RAGVAMVLLTIALPRLDADWTPARLALLVVTPLAGAMLFAARFLAAGAGQFWLVEGAEFPYAFTYGASYAASFSPAVLSVPLRALFTFVVPAAFAAYLPAVSLLVAPR